MLGRDYSGLAITMIILAGLHVILSAVFMVMACKKKMHKECGAWLVSLLVVVAILVLAAIATGQKDNYDVDVDVDDYKSLESAVGNPTQ